MQDVVLGDWMKVERHLQRTSSRPERLRRRIRILRVGRQAIPGGDLPPAAVIELISTGEALASENATLRDTVTRQKAEFDNFRQRSQKERTQIRQTAIEDVFSELLPVIDNFDRAMESTAQTTDAAAIRDGVQMVREQMLRMLESRGLKRIEALGAEFNPVEHDGVAVEERADVPENRVIKELLPGYRVNDRVLRPAMVKVAKAPAKHIVTPKPPNEAPPH